MKARWVAIRIAEEGPWSLLGITSDGPASRVLDHRPDAPLAERALACRLAARGSGWSIGRPVLALPASMCLAATIPTHGLHRSSRAAGMLYRLEEFLPLDAEQITADFLPHRQQALGVAILTEPIRQIVEALIEQGIRLSAIVPAALLAAQADLRRRRIERGGWLLHEARRLDRLILDEGVVTHWRQGPADDLALASMLDGEEASEDGARWWLCTEDEGVAARLGRLRPAASIERIEREPAALIAESAAAIACHEVEPLIDLQRGALAGGEDLQRIQGPCVAAMMSIALLLLVLTGANLRQSGWLAASIRDHQARQEQMHREAFPGQNVPAAPLSHLRSEHRRLAGTSGQSDPLPGRTSALTLLHQTLASLPTDLRYRVLEIRLDAGELYIDGQARSHSDADRIAAALRHGTGLAIDPPRTENLPDNGIAFTLIGNRLDQALARERQP